MSQIWKIRDTQVSSITVIGTSTQQGDRSDSINPFLIASESASLDHSCNNYGSATINPFLIAAESASLDWCDDGSCCYKEGIAGG